MSAMAVQSAAAFNRRKSCWLGTPEIYFRKTIDNSRLVKVEDPRRAREMKYFGLALCCLFLLVMGYALQHFRAIEYGYKIETLRSQRSDLVEMNRALRLEEASLRDPERIAAIIRAGDVKLGIGRVNRWRKFHVERPGCGHGVGGHRHRVEPELEIRRTEAAAV